MLTHSLFCSLLVVGALAAAVRGDAPRSVQRVTVFGHRGACGYRPEHTLESYRLAAELGADYLEPDLVSTKDGVLICRHDCEIGETTDAAERFPERKRAVSIDGKMVEGWFAADFTLAEIKQLRARERTKFRSHEYDGQFEVPTFAEVLELVRRESEQRGRPFGICPELKHPSHHAEIGLAMEDRLVALLDEHGYRTRDDLCIIQSFETTNLRYLATKTGVRLLQLLEQAHLHPADAAAKGSSLTYGDMMQPDGLATIAEYAWGIGPWKESILPRDDDGNLGTPTTLIDDAHRAGLKVVVYTMRNEPQYLARDYQGDPSAEYVRWRGLGVDGVFSDFPDTALRALR